MTGEDYEAGKRDARLDVIERTQAHHESRLRLIEKILWSVVGAFGLIQLVPTLEKVFG